jgi:hypothetical protein
VSRLFALGYLVFVARTRWGLHNGNRIGGGKGLLQTAFKRFVEVFVLFLILPAVLAAASPGVRARSLLRRIA